MRVGAHSNRLAILIAALLAPTAGTAHAAGDINSTTDVSAYAVGCFEKLRISEATLKAANGDAADLDCKHASAFKLKTTWTKNANDPAPADCDPTCDLDVWAANNPNPNTPWPGTTATPRTAAPPLCDYPAWLEARLLRQHLRPSLRHEEHE
jgi:hypothetical protein